MAIGRVLVLVAVAMLVAPRLEVQRASGRLVDAHSYRLRLSSLGCAAYESRRIDMRGDETLTVDIRLPAAGIAGAAGRARTRRARNAQRRPGCAGGGVSGSRLAPRRRPSSEWASELVSGHWQELCAYAGKRSGCDVDQAQDIAAGAILLLVTGRLDAEPLTKRQALGQMKNVIGKRALQWLDRRRRRGTVEISEALPDIGAADPERSAELSEMRSLIQEVFRQLPPAERRVVEFCDLHGMKPRDVARESGRSVKTVYEQLWKGRDRMRA